jgi:hypothetical protein
VALPVATVLGVVLPFAALGFYWDVAWHIDRGRDEFLFSPPHVALLVGLAGLGVAGALSVFLATRESASEVPVAPERGSPFLADAPMLQREAHDGPAWPGVVAYTWVALAIGGLLAILVAGFVALDRCRRAALWWAPPDGGVPSGRQVVLVGASG